MNASGKHYKKANLSEEIRWFWFTYNLNSHICQILKKQGNFFLVCEIYCL